MNQITVGILSLQGCVTPHFPHLEALNVKVREVKTEKDTIGVDGYILPGGESSTMLKLMGHFNLQEFFKKEFSHKPAWGICAGAILLSREVQNVKQYSFNLIDYAIKRNAYGRQLDSREVEIDGYPVCFIRAPIICDLGNTVKVQATYHNDPVWVTSGNYMATTFHPELSEKTPSPMHQYFVEMVKNHRKNT